MYRRGTVGRAAKELVADDALFVAVLFDLLAQKPSYIVRILNIFEYKYRVGFIIADQLYRADAEHFLPECPDEAYVCYAVDHYFVGR